MRAIAAAAKDESRSVATVLAEAQKDSRTVKVLTFVAMLYLPASLIAVSMLLHMIFRTVQITCTPDRLSLAPIWSSSLLQKIPRNQNLGFTSQSNSGYTRFLRSCS